MSELRKTTDELQNFVLNELGIKVSSPEEGAAIVESIAARLRSTPGTMSHFLAEAELTEAAWGAADGEEE